MSQASALDLIEELRLRRWARLNYVAAEDRSPKWHAVILNEMALRDLELQDGEFEIAGRKQIVPLQEQRILRLDGAHRIGKAPKSAGAAASEPAEFHYA
jgi:hypothetical protein